MEKNKILVDTEQVLLAELSTLIEQSKEQVVSQVNSTLTLLFWNIGNRINKEILQDKRADYGKRIVPTLSAQLEERSAEHLFGKGFGSWYFTGVRSLYIRTGQRLCFC